MDFASYMGPLGIFWQIMIELIACFSLSIFVRFGLVAMGHVFFFFFFFLVGVCFCVYPLGFVCTQPLRTDSSAASASDSAPPASENLNRYLVFPFLSAANQWVLATQLCYAKSSCALS